MVNLESENSIIVNATGIFLTEIIPNVDKILPGLTSRVDFRADSTFVGSTWSGSRLHGVPDSY